MVATRYPGFLVAAAFLPLSRLITAVTAAPTNFTIDDQNGGGAAGASLSFTGSWSLGPQCTGCKAQPDPSKCYDGTWHDATIHPGDPLRNATVSFTGTAVYVYGILANTIPYVTTNTNLTFTLDGSPSGSFVHNPTTSTDFEYNVPMYVNSNLPSGQHTVFIDVIGDSIPSFVLIDYIVYTVEEDPPTTQSSPPQPTSSPSSNPSPSTSFISSGTSLVSGTSSQVPLPLPSSSSSLHPLSGPSSFLSSAISASIPSTTTNAGITSIASTPQNTARPHSALPVRAMAGGTIGGVAALILLTGLLCFIRRRGTTVGGPLSLSAGEKRGRTNAGGGLGGLIAPRGGAPASIAAVQSPFVDEPTLYSSTPTAASSLPSTATGTKLTSTKKGGRRAVQAVDETVDRQHSPPDAPLSPSVIPPLSVPAPSQYTNTDDIQVPRTPPSPSVPDPRSPSPPPVRSPTPRTGVSTLQNQVAYLQEEVARLRAEQELQHVLAEPPPQYVP